MSKENGGPAFPQPLIDAGKGPGIVSADDMSEGGMTLRDYFAAKAMQGIFTFWVAVKTVTSINDPDPKIVAEMAYEYADAMLAERSKP